LVSFLPALLNMTPIAAITTTPAIAIPIITPVDAALPAEAPATPMVAVPVAAIAGYPAAGHNTGRRGTRCAGLKGDGVRD
jgi:hypothetical protein